MIKPIGIKQLSTIVEPKRIKTGIFEIDKKGGIRSNDFIVMAGSSGTGKSYLSLFMACSAAKKGHNIVYIDLENGAETIAARIKSQGFNIHTDFGKIDEKHGTERLKIFEDHNIAANPLETIENVILTFKPDFLVIDLFNVFTASKPTYMISQVTTELAVGFHRLAQKNNCAIMVLQQFTKDNSRHARRPVLDDISGGAGLVHKATKVFTLFRYSKERVEKVCGNDSEIVKKIIELIPRKDRHGDLPQDIILLRNEGGIHEPLTMERNAYLELVFKTSQGGMA